MSFEWQPITSQPAGSLHAEMSDVTVVAETDTEVVASPWLYPHGKRRGWSTGLFSCFSDTNTCILGTLVPCHMCFLASSMGESLLVATCVPTANLVLRSLVRGRHNIEGSVMNDCFATTFCSCCAQCQLAREIKMIQRGEALP